MGYFVYLYAQNSPIRWGPILSLFHLTLKKGQPSWADFFTIGVMILKKSKNIDLYCRFVHKKMAVWRV